MTDYIFDGHPQDLELKRLQLIEKSLDPFSIELFRKAPPRPGNQVLEVGAGAGSLLEWMGGGTGPRGLAFGVDKNTQYLEHLQDPPFKIFEGDILEFFPEEKFDLIHARYVLIHNEDPRSLLKKFKSLLKPGGKIILEEPDFSAARWLDPEYASGANKVNGAIHRMFLNKGLDPAYGANLPLDLSQGRFEILEYGGRLHLARGGSGIARVMEKSAEALAQAYLDTGACREIDLQDYLEGTRDPDSWAIYYATISLIAKA